MKAEDGPERFQSGNYGSFMFRGFGNPLYLEAREGVPVSFGCVRAQKIASPKCPVLGRSFWRFSCFRFEVRRAGWASW